MTGDYKAALVRPPGDSFRLAISLHPERDLIDPERARLQHRAYRNALAETGLEIVVLPPDERHPDSCFIQDPAFVLEGRALILRLGSESRAGEPATVEPVLEPWVNAVEHVEAPATLEGGDILRIGNRLFVGQSTRTNDAGAAALRRFAEPLGFMVAGIAVPRGVLHLTTAVTAVSEELIIGLDEVLADPAFAAMERIPVGESPLAACNVLAIGDHVIASGDYEIHDEIERRGFKVHRLNLSETVRADGGPTCLALLIG